MALALASRDYGQDGVGRGAEPMLLLHGLFGSALNWHSIALRLAAEREVLAVDLRNHGASPHAPEMDYDAMAEDLRALLDARGCAAATVVGHSMGGKAAMALALRSPERVRRLIVVDIAPVAYGHTYLELIDAALRLDLARVERRADADRMLAADVPQAAVRALLLQNLVRRSDGWIWRINWAAIAANHDKLLGFAPRRPEPSAALPAMFIRGGASDYLRPEHLPAIRSMFPAATVRTIEGAGHWVHVDRPRELVELLVAPAH